MILLLAAFWATQAAASIFLKYGSTGSKAAPRRWLIGFLIGNAVGMASMWLSMLIYGAIPNANIAAALAGGGAFVVTQLALAGVFRSRLSRRQWSGVAMTALGLLLAGWNVGTGG
jgi:hypothetical protein